MDVFDRTKSIICSLSLCVAIMSTTSALSQSSRDDTSLPVLYGVKLDGTRISIDVVSYADTFESDFSVQLDPESPNAFRLSILRHREDRGKVGAHIVTLTLELPPVAKLEDTKLRLMNRLATPGTLVREP